MNDLKTYKYVQPTSYRIGDKLYYRSMFSDKYIEVEIIDIYIDMPYRLGYETVIDVKAVNSDTVYKVILSDDGYRLVQKI